MQNTEKELLTQRNGDTESKILNKREGKVLLKNIQDVKYDDISMSMKKKDAIPPESTLKRSSMMTNKIHRQNRNNDPSDDKPLSKIYSLLSHRKLDFGDPVQTSIMCDKSNKKKKVEKVIINRTTSCLVVLKIIIMIAQCYQILLPIAYLLYLLWYT